MAKAFVLGITGTVGSAVATALAAAGWEVCGAARGSDPRQVLALENCGIAVQRFDVVADDPARLPDADVCFLEIWDPTRPELIWPINFYGVGRVVERYAPASIIVNGCTINVYGDGPEPSSEATDCRPTSEYGRSRYAQERLIDYFCDRHGQRAIHLRYAHANDARHGILRRFADRIVARESLGPDPDARLQVIGLADFVRCTVAAVDRAANPPPAVNICHPRLWTQRQLATALHAELGRGEVRFEREYGGVEHSACATAERMVAWFGEPQVPLADLIARVAAATP